MLEGGSMKAKQALTRKEVSKIFDEILNLGEKPVVHTTPRGASYVKSLDIIASLPNRQESSVALNNSQPENELATTNKTM